MIIVDVSYRERTKGGSFLNLGLALPTNLSGFIGDDSILNDADCDEECTTQDSRIMCRVTQCTMHLLRSAPSLSRRHFKVRSDDEAEPTPSFSSPSCKSLSSSAYVLCTSLQVLDHCFGCSRWRLVMDFIDHRRKSVVTVQSCYAIVQSSKPMAAGEFVDGMFCFNTQNTSEPHAVSHWHPRTDIMNTLQGHSDNRR